MSDAVQMPALGESVTEGTVTRWLKQVGERIEVDEPLLEVSTDKVDTEIPSPVAGVIERILVGEDETVEVGADLVVIGDGSGDGGGDGGTGNDQASAEAQEDAPPEQGDGDGDAQDGGDEGHAEDTGGEQEKGDRDASQAREALPDEGPASAPPPTEDSRDGTTITMPALGESVSEGTVTRWLKNEGDTVEADEPLLEVSTDKVDTEIPSPVSGVVRKLLVAEDETVDVGADLAIVDGGASGDGDGSAASDQQPEGHAPEPAEQRPAEQRPDEQRSADDDSAQEPAEGESSDREPADEPAGSDGGARATDEASAQASADAPEPAPASSAGSEAPERDSGSRVASDGSQYVTPLVRRMASENGVDLSSITGTGVGGRIRKQDVIDAAKAREAEAERARQAPSLQPDASKPPPEKGVAAASRAPAISALRGTTVKMSRLRRVIAQRMVESLQTSAQLTTVVEVDITRIARLRERAKDDFFAREGVKLSFLPFFAVTAVEALKQFPVVNASIEGDEIVYHGEENLGIAVDTERGLLVPVIHRAGDLNIAGLARKISDLADRTRRNKVTPDELGGGTFTLTNTGSRGALFDTPIINQPQVAILGTGAVVKRPVVVTDDEGGENIAIRSIAYLALSYDHRLVDGADAARFLVAVRTRLEEGAFEADLGL